MFTPTLTLPHPIKGEGIKFEKFQICLVRDLDNPFGYYESDSTEDVSLKPLDDLIDKLTKAI